MRAFAVTLAVFLLQTHCAVRVVANDAAEHVKQGILHFRAGEFEAASRAFTEADVAAPDNPRIAFDRGCAQLALGETDKAIDLLRDSAMSRDAELAASSRYNLGEIQAAKAKEVFGEDPAAAAPEVREEGLRMLVAAIGHWRDCLEVDPNHVAARHNLEVVRLWIKHMQDVWAQRDRQKQREEMDVLAMLRMIETQQTQLRQAAKGLNTEPDSPRRRQAARQASQAQTELADEVEALKDKFQELLQTPPSGTSAGSPPPDDQQQQRALGVLNELANNARSAMRKAAVALNASQRDSSVAEQRDALDNLNEIYMAIAPFQDVVQRAIGTQEPLVTASRDIAEHANQNPDALGESNGQAVVPNDDSPEADYGELSRLQTHVEHWSQVLPLKAEQELQQQQAAEEAAEEDPNVAPPSGQPSPVEVERPAEAAEKAVELAPQIQQLTGEAAALLEQENAPEALPKQEQALKLLKEIADLLPKQDQQQEGQDDQQQQPDNQDEQRPSDEPQQPQKQEQKRQEKPDPKQNQAEAVLRKVRERERERRDREKQMQRYLRGSNQVDKDW